MDLLIPENINLSTLGHSDIYRHSDKYYYLIYLLYHIRNRDKRYRDEDYITLNGKVLCQILGGRYKKYLDDLMILGIIECDNCYLPGTKSKGYRLVQKFRCTKHKKIKIRTKLLIEKITKPNKQAYIDLPHLVYMERCVRDVKILYDEAIEFINKNKTDEDSYFSYYHSIDMIQHGIIYCKPDPTAGRIHSNITNLYRDLRQFLRYKDKPLFEIDIANSQPFLFNIIINHYYNLDNLSLRNLSYDHQDNTRCPIKASNYSDVELYRSLTSSGTFYEYVMNKLNITESRPEFKVRFFAKVFYSKESPNYVHDERKQFRELFPNVSRVISHYKKPDYRNLAITLQRKESDIMIKGVAKRLSEMNVFFLTIHDSILTTHKNLDVVKEIIIDEFSKKLCLIPTLRAK